MSAPPPFPPDPLQYYSPHYQPPRRPLSVSVIAWLAIVFGGLGVLGGFCILIPRQLLQATQPTDPFTRLFSSPGPIATMTLVSQIIGWIVDIFLLIAGIGSLQLKQWARILMIRIMLFQIFMLVVSIVYNVAIVMPAVAKIAKQNPNLPAVSIFFVTVFLAIALGAVYPPLIIYFYTRPRAISAFEEPAPMPPS